MARSRACVQALEQLGAETAERLAETRAPRSRTRLPPADAGVRATVQLSVVADVPLRRPTAENELQQRSESQSGTPGRRSSGQGISLRQLQRCIIRTRTETKGGQVEDDAPRRSLLSLLSPLVEGLDLRMPEGEAFLEISLGPGPRAIKVYPAGERRVPRAEIWVREPFVARALSLPLQGELTRLTPAPTWRHGEVDHTLPVECPTSIAASGDRAVAEWLAGAVRALLAWASPLADLETTRVPERAQWEIPEGAVVRRMELHDRYGGTRQGGIAPCRQSPNVLVFSAASSGQQHGYYDRWQGETFVYCGEEQEGDQEMSAATSPS